MPETGVSPQKNPIAEAIPQGAGEAIAYHGWGYDRHFWQAWEPLLAQQHILLKCFDRGYFGNPAQPTFSDSTGRKLVLAHSYGLHLCPPEQLQAADAVVVFASFVAFHPSDVRARRRSQRILQQMIEAYALDPEAVLRAFWEKCGHVPDRREQATPLLGKDLVALGRSQLSPEAWRPEAWGRSPQNSYQDSPQNSTQDSPQNSPPILLIQGHQDRIVAPDRALDLLTFLANPQATLIPLDGPHALAATQPQDCWNQCWARLKPAIEPNRVERRDEPPFIRLSSERVERRDERRFIRLSSGAIAQGFGQSVHTYDRHATAQQTCAQHLLALLDAECAIPPGPVLEFGCGTGFLTQGLLSRLGGDRDWEITDLSAAMLEHCQQRLSSIAADPTPPKHLETSAQKSPQFYVLNAEDIPTTAGPYALIASNFALQWFQTPQASVVNLLRSLLPGGWLLLSFPSDRSFPQWRSHCANLGLPRPGNELPDPEPLIQALRSRSRQCFVQAHDLPLQFPSALDFLKHFKAIGAATPLAGDRPSHQLSPGQLRQLITTWDHQNPNGITVDYHAICLAVQK